jgi:hypothetical protein
LPKIPAEFKKSRKPFKKQFFSELTVSGKVTDNRYQLVGRFVLQGKWYQCNASLQIVWIESNNGSPLDRGQSNSSSLQNGQRKEIVSIFESSWSIQLSGENENVSNRDNELFVLKTMSLCEKVRRFLEIECAESVDEEMDRITFSSKHLQ